MSAARGRPHSSLHNPYTRGRLSPGGGGGRGSSGGDGRGVRLSSVWRLLSCRLSGGGVGALALALAFYQVVVVRALSESKVVSEGERGRRRRYGHRLRQHRPLLPRSLFAAVLSFAFQPLHFSISLSIAFSPFISLLLPPFLYIYFYSYLYLPFSRVWSPARRSDLTERRPDHAPR